MAAGPDHVMGLRHVAIGLAFGLACSGAGPVHAAMKLETVLPAVAVSPNDVSAFNTPLAYRRGVVYTANVEPGISADALPNLHTVVRRGVRDAAGGWQWKTHLLDAHTAADPYHTEASIALDKRGYVHVAYGMHYLPWQYAVSTRPDTIAAFRFRSQYVPPARRDTTGNDPINFPGPGQAAIPGNQITYPAFFTDRNDSLYITYRYAVKPRRSYFSRVFAGGIARYNAETQTWHQIGGAVRQSRADVQLPFGVGSHTTHPFAMQPGWWVYSVRLAFDRNNGMHVTWAWRKGNSGTNVQRPSYAYSPDGGVRFYRSNGSAYNLPITLDSAENIAPKAFAELAPRGLYSPAQITTSPGGKPSINVQAIGGRVYVARLGAGSNDQWRRPTVVPYDARQIISDGYGYEWAFATGLNVLRRRVDASGAPQSGWRRVFSGGDLCNLRVIRAIQERAFYVEGNLLEDGACQTDRMKIVRLSGLP